MEIDDEDDHDLYQSFTENQSINQSINHATNHQNTGATTVPGSKTLTVTLMLMRLKKEN